MSFQGSTEWMQGWCNSDRWQQTYAKINHPLVIDILFVNCNNDYRCTSLFLAELATFHITRPVLCICRGISAVLCICRGMFLAGHSAGAHLAIMALLSAQSNFHLVKRKQWNLTFKIIFHKLGTKCYELLVLYLRYIYARSSLCWTARIMPTLRDKLLGFLLTSESSSNYVCSCPNVNARWHHHTLHRCASSCRPTLVVVSYDQRLVMISWSHVPELLATVYIASPCPARRHSFIHIRLMHKLT